MYKCLVRPSSQRESRQGNEEVELEQQVNYQNVFQSSVFLSAFGRRDFIQSFARKMSAEYSCSYGGRKRTAKRRPWLGGDLIVDFLEPPAKGVAAHEARWVENQESKYREIMEAA